jgi:DNA-binding NarL/FixJ family response regulator
MKRWEREWLDYDQGEVRPDKPIRPPYEIPKRRLDMLAMWTLGITQKEIARYYGISVGRVGSVVKQAKRQLAHPNRRGRGMLLG